MPLLLFARQGLAAILDLWKIKSLNDFLLYFNGQGILQNIYLELNFMEISYLQAEICYFCYSLNRDWRPYWIYGKSSIYMSFYYIPMGRASSKTYIQSLISWKYHNYKPRYVTFAIRPIGIGRHIGFMQMRHKKWRQSLCPFLKRFSMSENGYIPNFMLSSRFARFGGLTAPLNHLALIRTFN